MTAVTPLVQFPWPLVLGGSVGLAIAVGVVSRYRQRARLWVVALSAAALAGAAAGAFVALAWLWTAPMSRPFHCLYVCEELQFLSTEQFRQLVLMSDLAWILTTIVLISGAVAAWAWRPGSRS